MSMNQIRRVRARLHEKTDRGASLVEFALLMPLLILLLFGMIEFSWLFARNLDVNQGAREGARLIAVDTPTGNSALQDEICSRMNLVGLAATTTVAWTAEDIDGDTVIGPGDGVSVTVSAQVLPTLTGLLDSFFSGLTTIDSTVEIRIEQPPTWTDLAATACP